MLCEGNVSESQHQCQVVVCVRVSVCVCCWVCVCMWVHNSVCMWAQCMPAVCTCACVHLCVFVCVCVCVCMHFHGQHDIQLSELH